MNFKKAGVTVLKFRGWKFLFWGLEFVQFSVFAVKLLMLDNKTNTFVTINKEEKLALLCREWKTREGKHVFFQNKE